jgi:hypothetical protein
VPDSTRFFSQPVVFRDCSIILQRCLEGLYVKHSPIMTLDYNAAPTIEGKALGFCLHCPQANVNLMAL